MTERLFSEGTMFSIFDLIGYIFLSWCFILFPLWIVLFIAGYFLEAKKIKYTGFIMPIALFAMQLALIHFYGESRLNDKVFFLLKLLEYFTILSTGAIIYLKLEHKQNWYLIPFLSLVLWIIIYLFC